MSGPIGPKIFLDRVGLGLIKVEPVGLDFENTSARTPLMQTKEIDEKIYHLKNYPKLRQPFICSFHKIPMWKLLYEIKIIVPSSIKYHEIISQGLQSSFPLGKFKHRKSYADLIRRKIYTNFIGRYQWM